MLFVVGGWCGRRSRSPVYEGQDVDIICYVRYDWLTYYRQYNPVVSVVSSAEFVGVPGTLASLTPNVTSLFGRPPFSEFLNTSHTIRNVQSGQTISHTCRVTFDFVRNTSYSGRNRYANNSLEWTCRVRIATICEYIIIYVTCLKMTQNNILPSEL